MLRQSVLRTRNLAIPQNTHWRILASRHRTQLVISITDSTGGFDFALTEENQMPLADEWIDKFGTAVEKNTNLIAFTSGCGGEIHFRDGDNLKEELIRIVSDVYPEFELVGASTDSENALHIANMNTVFLQKQRTNALSLG